MSQKYIKSQNKNSHSAAYGKYYATAVYDNRFVEASYSMFHNFFNIVGSDWNEGYSYMALCCYDLKRYDEFLEYLQKALKHNPQEARQVLSQLFPEGMKPEEYYEHMKKIIK